MTCPRAGVKTPGTNRLHEGALDRMGAVNHVAPLSVDSIAASLMPAASRNASTCFLS